MKIVIAGGRHEAEYIVHLFNKPENTLVIINPSKEESDLIMRREHLPVYVGTPWKSHVLEESESHKADVFIALADQDCDNYAACKLAKTLFGAKKCICLVSNPNNVELYKKLGIDSVISSTYLLGDSVMNESSLEDIVKAISFENDRVSMIEATILPKFKIANKRIMDAKFPPFASIACIVRGIDVIIPNGQVIIRPKDKLMVICSSEDEKRITSFIKNEKSAEEIARDVLKDKGEEPAEPAKKPGLITRFKKAREKKNESKDK